MFPEDLSATLHARPFRPFRIVLSDGMTYEVRHPEMVMVALGSAFVGYPDKDRARIAHHVDIIGLQLISRLEFLDQPSSAIQGNGATQP